MEPAPTLRPDSPRPSSRSRARWWVAAGFALAMLVPDSALAGEGSHDAGEGFQLQWRMAPPTLRLQPEGARLVLNLPIEWMPPPDLGRFGMPLDPNKHWKFRRADQLTSASIGTGLRLSVEDRARSVWFGISVLPRAAVAVLRFDPLAQVR